MKSDDDWNEVFKDCEHDENGDMKFLVGYKNFEAFVKEATPEHKKAFFSEIVKEVEKRQEEQLELDFGDDNE